MRLGSKRLPRLLTSKCKTFQKILPMSSFGVWAKVSAREGGVMLTLCKPCSSMNRILQPHGLGEAARSCEEVKEDHVVTSDINRENAFNQHKTVGLYNNTIARGLKGLPGYKVPRVPRAFALWRKTLDNQITRVPDHGE